MEDLNYLLHREQVEILLARETTNASAKAAHDTLARAYARRIDQHRLSYRTPQNDGSKSFDPGRFGAPKAAIA
ncbi:hypothetical protein KFK14_13925 [Sphingobium phenoxybenzoativorans]|uniref:Uncharacterized protein n=1 Tax=Sphingobium phenoxybenzoativorans TaxID=1592790 RepID=A0A975K3K0_9SPHN|nr:hypothetical protein [Sphingobium phenoxybenzoativorans]QUT04229.1 hypothetical protein KFK14_13925 [Sphingobium phenoxybenzoativorans]